MLNPMKIFQVVVLSLIQIPLYVKSSVEYSVALESPETVSVFVSFFAQPEKNEVKTTVNKKKIRLI